MSFVVTKTEKTVKVVAIAAHLVPTDNGSTAIDEGQVFEVPEDLAKELVSYNRVKYINPSDDTTPAKQNTVSKDDLELLKATNLSIRTQRGEIPAEDSKEKPAKEKAGQ